MTPSDSRHSFPVMRLVDESRSKTWSRTFRVSRIVPKNSSEIPQWNMIQNSTNSRVLHDNWEKNTWTTGHQISNNGECFPAIRVVITTFFGKSLTNFRYFVATRDSGFPRVGHICRILFLFFPSLWGALLLPLESTGKRGHDLRTFTCSRSSRSNEQTKTSEQV